LSHKSDGRSGVVNTELRDSSTASLDDVEDVVVQRIRDRALAFQGFHQSLEIETLVVQRYNISGHYVNHYDWLRTNTSGNRGTTFMVYLDGNCTGGGTNFPRLPFPAEKRWCDVIDCDENRASGVTFKPISGNAIFWANLQTDGTGHPDTLHAALAVETGQKTGLNIWSWQTF
jgi:prolyl 4-hydroxylase